MSNACLHANSPAASSFYEDFEREFGELSGPYFPGETLTVSTDSDADAIAMGINDFSIIEIDQDADLSISHTFTTAGNATWTGIVGSIIFGAVEWQVSCTPTSQAIISPYGAVVDEPADGETVIVQVPVFLATPVAAEVTVDWTTTNSGAPGRPEAGSDFEAASGTVTFSPGQTTAYVSIEVLGDGVAETPLLWGEWLVLEYSNPSSNAIIETDTFFGAGLVIIVDADVGR